ncbi:MULTISPECIES: GIY-YIG nuclease family protein [unclassified Nocardioides]|uniref:GIY-YIG nuclease family protein n=1 Tax=unclassified Nocardioides TaxID=2615069 RepID=UPI00301457F9
MPYAYLLRCSDDSYYAGSTWDLEVRLWQHNESPDLGAAYTRRRRPVELVWSAWFDSVEEAYLFEKRIQGWSRRKREALIRGEYDALPNLSRRAAVQRRAATSEGTGSAPTPGSPGFEARA